MRYPPPPSSPRESRMVPQPITKPSGINAIAPVLPAPLMVRQLPGALRAYPARVALKLAPRVPPCGGMALRALVVAVSIAVGLPVLFRQGDEPPRNDTVPHCRRVDAVRIAKQRPLGPQE